MLLDGWWFHWKCKDCGAQMYSAEQLKRAEQLCGMCSPTTVHDAAKRAFMWEQTFDDMQARHDKWLDKQDWRERMAKSRRVNGKSV
jgi:acetyl-CoA carboxylase beta subunit